ncbi:MAG: Hsp20/alpha crystallin family protein [Campylobacterales bacterium]
MVPVRFDPFGEFRQLEERMNRLFGNLPAVDRERGNISAFAPAVNTREEENAYVIEADLPGVDKDAIKIDLHGNTLTLSGERKEEKEEDKEGYHLKESFFGKFQRSFTLPEDVDADKIDAKNKNGVLTITLPKAPPKDKKQIAIK